jgi:hypothetical protein
MVMAHTLYLPQNTGLIFGLVNHFLLSSSLEGFRIVSSLRPIETRTIEGKP